MFSLIGSGVIGSSLLDSMAFDRVYNSTDIGELAPGIDTLVIAAPSGNRLAVNRGDTGDKLDCDEIVAAVSRAVPRRVVLLGSVDAVTAPDSEYGRNRRYLETMLGSVAPTAVIRLCTLIGSNIRKNVLYDIKHNQFLDEVDAGAWLQWCVLADLPEHIRTARPGTVLDLVSEPIANLEVLHRYISGRKFNSRPVSLHYNQGPYMYTREEIFQAMDRYML